MGVLFTQASTQYATIDSPPFTGYPFTVYTWWKPTSLATDGTLWWCGDKDAAANYWRLYMNITTGTVSFGARNTTLNNATTANACTAGAWAGIGCVGISATSRRVRLNAGTVATNTTSTTPNATDRFAIGMSRDSTPTEPANGIIAMTAVWNVALSDVQLVALSRGLHPNRIRPGNLTGLWEMEKIVGSTVLDRTRNRRHLTLVASPTQAAGPPVAPPLAIAA